MPCVRITIKLIYDLGQFGSHGEVMTGFGNLESFLVCYSLAPVYIRKKVPRQELESSLVRRHLKPLISELRCIQA